MTKMKNAYNLFLESNRFDLIFKYLYLTNRDKNPSFFSKMYLESIRAFNNFHEDEPSDGIPKESSEDFLESFDTLWNSIKLDGFNEASIIPVGKNGEISDGAHRLVCAALLNLDIPFENDDHNDNYDYKFFMERDFNTKYADYGAIEYVKLQPNSYIVNLHAVVDEKYDENVESILRKYGRIYYKKKVPLNFNGYVNLKKISYGSFWEKESWIGDVKNGFQGAQEHAKHSMGDGKYLRAYVYVCENSENLIKIKSEIRNIFNIGNYCIHINDHHEEALALAQLFFNDNSIQIMNIRPFWFEDKNFDLNIVDFKEKIFSNSFDNEDFCIGGSSPLNILGIRKSDDIDFLYYKNELFPWEDSVISNHYSEEKYYPSCFSNIIYDNDYFFYYLGQKFISLKTLYKLKRKRGEYPKDVRDCKIIDNLLKKNSVMRKSFLFKMEKSVKMFMYTKIKNTYRKIKNMIKQMYRGGVTPNIFLCHSYIQVTDTVCFSENKAVA